MRQRWIGRIKRLVEVVMNYFRDFESLNIGVVIVGSATVDRLLGSPSARHPMAPRVRWRPTRC